MAKWSPGGAQAMAHGPKGAEMGPKGLRFDSKRRPGLTGPMA